MSQNGLINADDTMAVIATSESIPIITNRIELILADTIGGAFTITLPAVPIVGRSIRIIDQNSNFNINNLMVDATPNKFMNNDSILICDVSGMDIKLVYADDVGWVISDINTNTNTNDGVINSMRRWLSGIWNNRNVAIGYDQAVRADSSVAIGYNNVAIGFGANASGGGGGGGANSGVDNAPGGGGGLINIPLVRTTFDDVRITGPRGMTGPIGIYGPIGRTGPMRIYGSSMSSSMSSEFLRTSRSFNKIEEIYWRIQNLSEEDLKIMMPQLQLELSNVLREEMKPAVPKDVVELGDRNLELGNE